MPTYICVGHESRLDSSKQSQKGQNQRHEQRDERRRNSELHPDGVEIAQDRLWDRLLI